MSRAGSDSPGLAAPGWSDPEAVPVNVTALVIDESITVHFHDGRTVLLNARTPTYPTRPTTEEERSRTGLACTRFEKYPDDFAPLEGRYWS